MYFTSASSRLLLYDSNSWDCKKSYGCYDGLLRDVSWSDDSKYMMQVNSKGLVEILSAADHDVRSLQHVPIKDSWSACFHRDGHRNVAIGTKSGNVLIWDTKNKTIIKTFPTPNHSSAITHVSYNSKNNSLAATMLNGDTIIYSLITNIPILTVKLSSKSISTMKFHHDLRALLGVATDDGDIFLRDVTTNKEKAVFDKVHISPISDITFSLKNNDVLLSTGYDKIMNIYDIRKKNIVSTVKTPYTLTSLAINNDNQVALGTKNGYVLLYDLRDLSNPFKVLTDHEDEIRKVAFQPLRKKVLQSAEISLKEDMDILTPNMTSPVRTRTSDMFIITDSSPRNSYSPQCHIDNGKAADSFMALINDIGDEGNRTVELDKSDRLDIIKFKPIEEKNITKMSTPLTSRTGENLILPSPIVPNGLMDDLKVFDNKQSLNQLDVKITEDLKDFMKLTISEAADDNRNYFLHIMMALTKQNLYMEKQLAGVNEQLKTLVQNQNDLVEANRRFVLEIEQLKARQNLL